jgi:cobalamin synthase
MLAPYRPFPVLIGLFVVLFCFCAVWCLGSGGSEEAGVRIIGFPTVLGLLVVSQVVVLMPVLRLYAKRVGGYTGDTLGAVIESGELSYLFCMYLLFSSVIR